MLGKLVQNHRGTYSSINKILKQIRYRNAEKTLHRNVQERCH